MKLCTDCKFICHWFITPSPRFKECSHEKLNTEEVNPVDGSFFKLLTYCQDVRRNEAYCGKEGKWFEEKKYLVPATAEEEQTVYREKSLTRNVKKAKSVTLEDLL